MIKVKAIQSNGRFKLFKFDNVFEFMKMEAEFEAWEYING